MNTQILFGELKWVFPTLLSTLMNLTEIRVSFADDAFATFSALSSSSNAVTAGERMVVMSNAVRYRELMEIGWEKEEDWFLRLKNCENEIEFLLIFKTFDCFYFEEKFKKKNKILFMNYELFIGLKFCFTQMKTPILCRGILYKNVTPFQFKQIFFAPIFAAIYF